MQQALFACRALSEDESKTKSEVSANGTGALRENKSQAKFEVSATGTCRAFSEDEPKVKAQDT